MTDIVGAEKMMLGFNIEADKTIDYLKALSDVSMGNSQKFNSLTLAFSQMSAAGKLMGQDLNQFINAGFNPLQTIAEKTGKSIAQLKEEMSKGAISAEMVQQAFLDATSAGGKFYNMSENASKTINGQISMMQDAMDAAFNEIGTKTEGIIINSIKAATSLIQNYEKIGKVLVGLVTTYGVYRTAVIVATAAEKGLTVAELALTKARVLAKKAQDALNASMMTNPYVALAVVVAGLVASMWALRDSTSAAEKAQKRFNDIKEKAAQKEQEHKDAIQGLIEKVRDDTRAITERESAMIALRNQYPSIFARYDTESLKLANLIDLNKQLNEEMSLRARADAKNRITTQEDVIRKMERLGVSKERLDAEVKELQDFQKDYLMQYSLPDYVSSLKNLDLDKLQEELGGAKFMASGSGVGIYDGMQADKMFYESMVAAIEAEIKSRESVKKFYSDDYEAAKKKYEEDYAAFKWAEENKTKVTTKEYQNRKAAMEASEKEFKKLGGDPNEIKKENEKAGQQERLDSMTEKNAKKNARAAKDMEFKVWQSRIDAMKGGYAKTMAQKALDHQKELDSLERQKQDYIEKIVAQEKAIFDAQEDQKAKNDKKYKKRTFDADAVRIRVTSTDEVVKQYAKLGEDAAAAYSKAVEDAIREQDFTERQQMIDSMSDGSSKERAQRLLDNEKELYNLEQQREAYIEAAKAAHILAEKKKMAADPTYMMKMFDESQANADYDVIVENTKRKQYDELADEYMSYIDKKNAIDADYEADKAELENAYLKTGDEKYKRSLDERTKAYIQAMEELEQSYDDAYKIIFRDPSKVSKEGLNESLKLAEKRLQSLIEAGAEAEQLEPLYEQIKAIREELDNFDISGIASDLMSLARQAENLRRIRASIKTLEVGSEPYKKAVEEEKRAEQDLKKSLVATGASEFANALTQAADAMHQIAEESGDVELAELANSLSTAGNIFSSAIQGMLQAGPWGMLIGLISSAVGAVVNLAVEAEAADARLASSLAAFRREIQLTKLEIDSADFEGIFGTQNFDMNADAIKKAQEAISLFKGEMEGLRHLTWKYGTGISWFPEEGVLFETYDKIDGLFNEDVWDENGLLDVEKARAYLETSKTITDEARSQVEYAIELREAYDAAQKVLDDFLTSFIGSTADDLTDAIFEGIDNGSDAWDIFEEKGSETIRSLGKQMIKELIIKDLTSMWTDRLREAAGDPTALADTYAEMMEWLKKQTAAYQNAAASWEEQYGGLYQPIEDESQQTASRKGYETLSEDTGNELVGRATAQYESNLRMEEATRGMKDSIDLMASNYIQIKNIAEESRTLIAHSYLELQQIRDNTGAIIRPIQNLSEKIDKWDSKIMDL